MSDAAAAVIELRDTSKSYGAVQAVDFHSPHDARDAGIAGIHQEPTLFPDLSIAENVVMGYHPLGALRRMMHSRVQGLLDRLGVHLDPERPVRGLSIADQQIVEIAEALSFEARVLIMDEPTAALSGPEVERLFAVVKTLREEGAAVLSRARRSSANDVNTRRQAELAEFFELPSGERPDTGLQRLEEVFHLA